MQNIDDGRDGCEPILVVDDNEQIVDILSAIHKKEGWPMLAARTGEEALDLFDAAGPSLILLDIMLPGIDGWRSAAASVGYRAFRF